MPMTFAEFVASGRDVPNLSAEGLGVGGAGRVYVYPGGPYINLLADGSYSLTIYNEQWAGPLHDLEKRLYDFAQSEMLLDDLAEKHLAHRPAPVASAWEGWTDERATALQAAAVLARDTLREQMAEMHGDTEEGRAEWPDTVFWPAYDALCKALS